MNYLDVLPEELIKMVLFNLDDSVSFNKLGNYFKKYYNDKVFFREMMNYNIPLFIQKTLPDSFYDQSIERKLYEYNFIKTAYIKAKKLVRNIKELQLEKKIKYIELFTIFKDSKILKCINERVFKKFETIPYVKISDFLS